MKVETLIIPLYLSSNVILNRYRVFFKVPFLLNSIKMLPLSQCAIDRGWLGKGQVVRGVVPPTPAGHRHWYCAPVLQCRVSALISLKFEKTSLVWLQFILSAVRISAVRIVINFDQGC